MNIVHRKKIFGFTIVEVMLTFVIIGVVSVLILPNVISNVRLGKNRARFKNTLTALNQAVKLNKSEFDFDFSDISVPCGPTFDNPEELISICAIIDGNMKGHSRLHYSIGSDSSYDYNIQDSQFFSKVKISDYNANSIQYSMADGTLVVFYGGFETMACHLPPGVPLKNALAGSIDTANAHFTRCVGFIDVNNNFGPNREIECSNVATEMDPDTPCTVGVNSLDSGDIFPIVFYDGTVYPATNASVNFVNIER